MSTPANPSVGARSPRPQWASIPYPVTITALILGGLSFLWSLLPWPSCRDAFLAYVFFYGPCFLFTLAVIIFVVVTRKNWHSLWLLLIAPAIYYVGGQMLMKWSVMSDWPPLLSSLLSAYAFLAACRWLIFRRCPWRVVFGWGLLAILSALPFLHPVFKIGEDRLGNLSFWGLHILIWYLAVAHTLDRMGRA